MSLAILDVQYICKEFSGMYTTSAHNTQRTTINSFDNKRQRHFAQILKNVKKINYFCTNKHLILKCRCNITLIQN